MDKRTILGITKLEQKNSNGVSGVKEITSVEQVKTTRAKQFVLHNKMIEEQEKDIIVKKVEKVAKEFKQQFSSNQDMISNDLDKQRNIVLQRIMNRRCQSFSRTLRDV